MHHYLIKAKKKILKLKHKKCIEIQSNKKTTYQFPDEDNVARNHCLPTYTNLQKKMNNFKISS